MTYAELRSLLEANEHEHALGALERIRFRVLEGRLAQAEATAERERRLRYEHTLTENDDLTRLRAENLRLRSENEALRRAVLAAAPAEHQAEPRRHATKPLLSPEALAIMYRDPPDPAAFDRTIGKGEEQV
jgi:multidrug efflux pump subunit AcrA (membrane-fusion protein)